MYAVSFIGVLLSFFEFGIAILTTTVISANKHNAERYIRNAFGLRLFSFLLAFTVLFILSFTSLLKHEVIVLTLLIYGFSNSLTLFFRSVYRGFEILKFEGLSIIIDRLTVIIICGTVLFLNSSLQVFTIAYSFSFFISAGISYSFYCKIVKNPMPSFNKTVVKESVIIPASVFAVMNILLVLRTNAPTLILEFLQTSNEVGFYNSGYRLIESYLLLPSIFVVPVYPYFVRLYKRKKILTKLILNLSRLILVITSFLIIPISIFNSEFTLLLYGNEYLEASSTIGFLLLSLFPMVLTVIFGSLVSATFLQKKANSLILFEVLLSLLLFYFSISFFAAKGAAITKIFLEVFMAVILISISSKMIKISDFIKLLFKFILILLLSFLFFYFLLPLLDSIPFILKLFCFLSFLFTLHLSFKTLFISDFKNLFLFFYRKYKSVTT